MQVVGRFGVNGNNMSTSFSKALDVTTWLIDHQVYVEGLGRILGHLLDDELAERDIRHEVTVHYVEVKPVSFAFINEFDGLVQVAKICG